MIEREAELATIDALIASGAGALLLEGEAGIGKTLLLAEARSRAADAGARVLHAVADATEARFSAGARVLLARASGRGFGGRALEQGLADPSADEVVHALFWLVADLAGEGPLALAFDDAQWAEPSATPSAINTARPGIGRPLDPTMTARGGRRSGRASYRRLQSLCSAYFDWALAGRWQTQIFPTLLLGRPQTLLQRSRGTLDVSRRGSVPSDLTKTK